jgi:mRNA interferase MazF
VTRKEYEDDLLSEWSALKQKLNKRTFRINFQDRELWWCSVGQNIANEIDGKGYLFQRPVLILKKVNKNSFIGIPLTTHPRKIEWNFTHPDLPRNSTAVISQIRVYDVHRLIRRMPAIPALVFELILAEVQASLALQAPAS